MTSLIQAKVQYAAAAAVLVLMCYLLFFYRLGDRGLGSSHEARAGQNAQSILDNRQWLLPQLFDRQVELQKPPFYYWIVAWLAQWRDNRVDAFLVRLPAALAAVGIVVIVFCFAAGNGYPRAGLVAAFMLANCLHFTWMGRVGRIDMPLSLTITVALVGFYHGAGQGRAALLWLALAYVSMGLGLLLKGPIAVVLPLAVWFAFAFIGANSTAGPWCVRVPRSLIRNLIAVRIWWGLPLSIAIAAPWYMAAAALTDGEWLRVFFWYHNVARGFGGAQELASHPWWYYGPRLVVDLMPWSLLLIPAGYRVFRSEQCRKHPLTRFALCWALTVTLLLSCSRFKRADYLLPAYPGFMLFLGIAAENWWRMQCAQTNGVVKRRVAVCVWLVMLLGCVMAWSIYVNHSSLDNVHSDPSRRFANRIRSQSSMPVVFFRAEAHDLAFHTGAPVVTVLEWKNLEKWSARSRPLLVVMPREELKDASKYLNGNRFEEVLRSADLTNQPLDRSYILLRTKAQR